MENSASVWLRSGGSAHDPVSLDHVPRTQAWPEKRPKPQAASPALLPANEPRRLRRNARMVVEEPRTDLRVLRRDLFAAKPYARPRHAAKGAVRIRSAR